MSRRRGRRKMSKSHAPKPSAVDQGVVDVVIPVFNQFEMLDACVASLPDAAGDCEIRVWLVDDASTHPLRQRKFQALSDRQIYVKHLSNAENLGFPLSVNRGVERGRGELVLILNSDVVLGPCAIEIMAEEFGVERIGVVGAKMLFPPDSTDPNRPAGTIQHAGMAVAFTGQPLHVHLGWPADHPRANRHREMQVVSGCCLMTRRTLWNEIGGFSEVYGKGTFEDMEYCVAARVRGFAVMYQPAAWGYHHVGASVTPTHHFPITRNLMIWKGRCGDYVYWDEWRFW